MKLKLEFGLVLSLVLAGIVYLILGDLEPNGRAVASAVIFMVTLWITNCVPVAASPFYFITFLYLTGIKDPYLLLSGYTSFMPWLLLALMFISASIKETSLDSIFSGLLRSKESMSPLQLYRILTTVNIAASPIVSNNVARMLFMLPLYNSTASLVNNKNYTNALYLSLIFINTITSQMFLLSEIPLMTIELIRSGTGINISWLDWFKMSWFPILGLMLLLQFTVNLVYFNNNKELMNNKITIVKQAIEFSTKHKFQLAIIVAFVLAWALEDLHGIHPVILSFITVVLLMYPRFGLLSWETVKKNVDWGTFLIVGTGLTLANLIQTYEINVYIVGKLPLQYISAPSYIKLAAVLALCGILRIAVAGTLGYLAVMLPLMISLAVELNLNPLVVGMLVSYIGASVVILPTCTLISALIVYEYKKLELNIIRNFGILFAVISIVWFVIVAGTYWPMIGLNLVK